MSTNPENIFEPAVVRAKGLRPYHSTLTSLSETDRVVVSQNIGGTPHYESQIKGGNFLYSSEGTLRPKDTFNELNDIFNELRLKKSALKELDSEISRETTDEKTLNLKKEQIQAEIQDLSNQSLFNQSLLTSTESKRLFTGFLSAAKQGDKLKLLYFLPKIKNLKCLNEVNDKGETALILMCRYACSKVNRNSELIELLIGEGSDMFLMDNNGKSAFSILMGFLSIEEESECLKTILSKGICHHIIRDISKDKDFLVYGSPQFDLVLTYYLNKCQYYFNKCRNEEVKKCLQVLVINLFPKDLKSQLEFMNSSSTTSFGNNQTNTSLSQSQENDKKNTSEVNNINCTVENNNQKTILPQFSHAMGKKPKSSNPIARITKKMGSTAPMTS